jgi:hypothetical protein
MLRSVRRAEAAEAADAAASLRAAKPTGFQVFAPAADASSHVAVGKVYKTYRGAMNFRAALKAGDPAGRFVIKHIVNGAIGR